MIYLNSRDPISLYSDLMTGFLSGQEDWVQEVDGGKHFTYANLFTCLWDYQAISIEGRKFLTTCAIKKGKYGPFEVEQGSNLRFSKTSFGEVHFLNRKQVHVYVRELELIRNYFKVIQELQALFAQEKVEIMTSVALHTSVATFSEKYLPMLYALFGRRAFLNPTLSTRLNLEIDNLQKILKPQYKNKSHQKVWEHVVSIIGRENIL